MASALVPAGVAEFVVTREEWHELSRGRVLVLETIQALHEELGSANVRDLAEIAGIGDEAVMASIVMTLANENLVLIEGDTVRTAPGLTLDGERVRMIVEKEQQTTVIGSPPLPCHSFDCARLRALESYEADTSRADVSETALDRWREEFWDQCTHRLQLKNPLEMSLYVLEGAFDQTLSLADEYGSVRLEIGPDHPFVRATQENANDVLKAAASLLRRFGDWESRDSTVRCTRDGLRKWWASGGRAESEVILSGAIDVAVYVKCRPADQVAAWEMLLRMLVDELDGTPGPCSHAELQRVANRLREGEWLCGHDVPSPTSEEVEAAAWDSGHWELAYRLGRIADGL